MQKYQKYLFIYFLLWILGRYSRDRPWRPHVYKANILLVALILLHTFWLVDCDLGHFNSAAMTACSHHCARIVPRLFGEMLSWRDTSHRAASCSATPCCPPRDLRGRSLAPVRRLRQTAGDLIRTWVGESINWRRIIFIVRHVSDASNCNKNASLRLLISNLFQLTSNLDAWSCFLILKRYRHPCLHLTVAPSLRLGSIIQEQMHVPFAS